MSICRSDLVLCLTAFCGHKFPEELALRIPLGLLCFLIHLGCTSGKEGGAQEHFLQPAGFKHSSFSPKDGPLWKSDTFHPVKSTGFHSKTSSLKSGESTTFLYWGSPAEVDIWFLICCLGPVFLSSFCHRKSKSRNILFLLLLEYKILLHYKLKYLSVWTAERSHSMRKK